MGDCSIRWQITVRPLGRSVGTRPGDLAPVFGGVATPLAQANGFCIDRLEGTYGRGHPGRTGDRARGTDRRRRARPVGSASVGDYADLFEEFGIEAFDDVAESVADPHYLMRRGVIFGHREYDAVAEAMANDEPFAAALSGFMPTGDPHIGHKLVFDEIIWHQQQGGDAFGLIADLEAHSARGMSWDEIDEHARNYLLSLLALGFDAEEGELYRQSDNREVQDLGFELGSKANFSEFEAIYGFDGETNISHMQRVITQTADILYPQLVDEPKPTVIPVGPDQDPHVRLTRDLATRVRYFKVTEAFASFELNDDERQLVRAAYDALAAGDESDGDAEVDVRCGDAAEWLADYEPPETDSEATDLVAAKSTALDKLGGGARSRSAPRALLRPQRHRGRRSRR